MEVGEVSINNVLVEQLQGVPCGLPRILRDWYQNVPQDVYFDIFDVPKKITLAKFGFLTNFVQPRDEKISISEMGGGDT